jgi:hypothetical protein
MVIKLIIINYFCLQLEKKLKQMDDQMVKADKEYFDSSKKAEQAREEYEAAVYKVLRFS